MMTRLWLLAALSVMTAGSAHAQDVVLTAGGGYSSGDFGSSRSTSMTTATIGARASSGRTTVAVLVPYVSTRSAGVVFAGFDGTPLVMLPDAGGPRRTYDGIGDPTLSISHDVPLSGVNLRGTARFKVPVQGLKLGVSTGKLDWSVSGEVSRTFGGVTPFVSVSYRGYGDPTGWRIRDGFAGSVGASGRVGPGAVVVSYEVARSTSDFVSDAHEIVGVYDMPVSRRMRLAAFGTVGLSNGVPDGGGGIRLSLTL